MIVVGTDNVEEARLDEYGLWQTDVGTTPEVKTSAVTAWNTGVGW